MSAIRIAALLALAPTTLGEAREWRMPGERPSALTEAGTVLACLVGIVLLGGAIVAFTGLYYEAFPAERRMMIGLLAAPAGVVGLVLLVVALS